MMIGVYLVNCHPGAGRDPLFSISTVDEWVPACAGMTIF
jgi:hypothetical protein